MSTVLILIGFGINCEYETKYAFEKAGAQKVDLIHISEVIKDSNILDHYKIIVIPGGFSFGDNLGAGLALASIIRLTIIDKIKALIDNDVIFLGICNGCQVLVKLGLFDYESEKITITYNKNNIGYRCIWRDCEAINTWHFEGIKDIRVPVAHGEGCFIDLTKHTNDQNKKTLLQTNFVNKNCKIILKYKEGQNHNGSDYDIAGVSNASGNVIALMPHLERAIAFEENKYLSNLQYDNNDIESSGISIYTRFFSNFVSKTN